MKTGDIIVTHRAILRTLHKRAEPTGLEGTSTDSAKQRIFEKVQAVAAGAPGRPATAGGTPTPADDPTLGVEMLAALSDALAALEAAEQDPGVLTALPHQTASLLQSYLAEQAAAGGVATPQETGGLEAQFDSLDVVGWAGSFFTWWQGLKKHPWLPPPAEPEPFTTALRVGILGDWGTGLYGAPACAASLKNDAKGCGLFLHLGDVYYSGTKDEMADRFLALWPQRQGAISRALNGNHEMYTGGHAYFEQALRAFKQPSSCFALQNEHWVLIGLDTAYQDHDLTPDQGPWLERLVQAAGAQRKVVLFSHHQPYSLLESQGPKLIQKVAGLLARRRIFAWYWGHEHRCVLYDEHPAWGVLGRCIGHSGYPYFRAVPKDARRVRGGDAFAWYRLRGKNLVPGGLLLDGPNPYVPGKAERYGCQGYATLDFNGPHLAETIHLPDGTEVFRQVLT